MPRSNFYSTAVAAALALSGTANAHLIMKTPKPFGNPDNSPLSSSGSNYPCKVTGDAATFYSGVNPTQMAVGEDQTLSFTGSAVHGGGSCQLAITSDMQPSASTTWQVIQSIEGGCPSKDGTSLSEYTYQIPKGTTAGDYVFAWTWISKLAGQPEYYMNCGPIKVTGGSSKREEMTKDLIVRANMPNLFVANLNSINSCKTTPGTDPTYPDPGTNVLKPNSAAKYANVDGTNCFPKGGSDSGSSSGSGSGSGSSAGSGTAATSAAAKPAPTSSASGFITSVASATTPGGVFVSQTSSAAAAPTSSSSAGGSSGSTGGGQNGKCTDEGMFNCVGGSQYQQCASGAWTTLQSMPAGTKCSNGLTNSLWGREIKNVGRRRHSLYE